MTPPKGEKVVPLRQDEPARPPPFQVGRSYAGAAAGVSFRTAAKASTSAAVVQGIDLSKKPKVILLAGRGKTGKTTAVRWMCERAIRAERPVLMGDADPGNMGFGEYFSDVHEPEDRDSAEIAFQWLEAFVSYAIEHKQTTVIDLGGGDTTLRRLADELPDLTKLADENGVAIVLIYFVGPQIDDLSPIGAMEGRQFTPHATAIVLNEAGVELGKTREQAFAAISSHPMLLGAFERGVIPVWMPRLIPWEPIELHRAQFTAARDGAIGKDGAPIVGPTDRLRVRAWLGVMEAQFGGILTWLP